MESSSSSISPQTSPYIACYYQWRGKSILAHGSVTQICVCVREKVTTWSLTIPQIESADSLIQKLEPQRITENTGTYIYKCLQLQIADMQQISYKVKIINKEGLCLSQGAHYKPSNLTSTFKNVHVVEMPTEFENGKEYTLLFASENNSVKASLTKDDDLVKMARDQETIFKVIYTTLWKLLKNNLGELKILFSKSDWEKYKTTLDNVWKKAVFAQVKAMDRLNLKELVDKNLQLNGYIISNSIRHFKDNSNSIFSLFINHIESDQIFSLAEQNLLLAIEGEIDEDMKQMIKVTAENFKNDILENFFH